MEDTRTQPTMVCFTGAEQEDEDLRDHDECTYKKSNKRSNTHNSGAGSKRRNKFLFDGVRQELLDLQRENEQLKILIWERIKPLQLAEMVLKDAEAPSIDIYLQSSVLMDEADACIQESHAESRVKNDNKDKKKPKSPNSHIKGNGTTANANANANNANDCNTVKNNKEKVRTPGRKGGRTPMLTRRHSSTETSANKFEEVEELGAESNGGDVRVPRVISLQNLDDSDDNCKPKWKPVIFHEEVDSLAAALSGNFAF